MITLLDHNIAKETELLTYYTPTLNDIECNGCGSELKDSFPGRIYRSQNSQMPDQTHVECSSCAFEGWRSVDTFTGGKTILTSLTQKDEVARSFGTSWADGVVWNDMVKKKATSDVKAKWYLPVRNDASDWGGGFLEVLYSEDSGSTWTSLGDTGFASDTMKATGAAAGNDNGFHVFKNLNSLNFQLKFRHKTYSGTITLNTTLTISAGSEFFSKLLLEEIG